MISANEAADISLGQLGKLDPRQVEALLTLWEALIRREAEKGNRKASEKDLGAIRMPISPLSRKHAHEKLRTYGFTVWISEDTAQRMVGW